MYPDPSRVLYANYTLIKYYPSNSVIILMSLTVLYSCHKKSLDFTLRL